MAESLPYIKLIGAHTHVGGCPSTRGDLELYQRLFLELYLARFVCWLACLLACASRALPGWVRLLADMLANLLMILDERLDEAVGVDGGQFKLGRVAPLFCCLVACLRAWRLGGELAWVPVFPSHGKKLFGSSGWGGWGTASIGMGCSFVSVGMGCTFRVSIMQRPRLCLDALEPMRGRMGR